MSQPKDTTNRAEDTTNHPEETTGQPKNGASQPADGISLAGDSTGVTAARATNIRHRARERGANGEPTGDHRDLSSSGAVAAADAAATVPWLPAGVDAEAIPEAIRPVLGLFAVDLAEVGFPGVDSQVLSAAAAEVGAEWQRLQEARREVDLARDALADRQGQLCRLAEQGLAYARVFAAEGSELAERLGAIAVTKRSGRDGKLASTRRKRGTAPKAVSNRHGGEGITQLPLNGGDRLESEDAIAETDAALGARPSAPRSAGTRKAAVGMTSGAGVAPANDGAETHAAAGG